MKMDKIDIFGLSMDELNEIFVVKGFKKFRAKQVFDWMYKKGIFSFEKMRNISKNDIALLEESFLMLPNQIKVLKDQISEDLLTRKVLLELTDGNSIETVCMKHNYGYSVCVSSQVGCNMNCSFCASGLTGCVRNLTVAEILLQVYFFNQTLMREESKVSRVVVMGSGEPMLNFENVFNALKFIHEPTVSDMSYRNMTVSTCGIIPGIVKMQELDLPINLAISLHAVNDDLRNELMPVNKKYNYLDVIKASNDYAISSGRQVTYEYILIDELNDSENYAEILVNLLKYKKALVNLIPANPVVEKGYNRSKESNVNKFFDVLKSHNINVTIRKEMGKDIDAACGQLRAKYK